MSAATRLLVHQLSAHPALEHGHPVTAADSTGSVLALVVLLALAGVAATRVADSPTDPVGPPVLWPATALAAAGGVHGVLLTQHVGQSGLHVGAVAAVAVGQLLLAVGLLLRPGPRLLSAAATSCAWLLLLSALTRLAHVPGTGGRYGVGPLDVAAAGLELAVVVGCLRARCAAAAGRRPPAPRPAPAGDRGSS